MTQPASLHRFVRHVPNALTIGRLALAIALPFASAPWRLPIVIAAGVSDGLDGFIARRFNAMSTTGAVLDAASDKAFTLSAILTLAIRGEIEWWMAAVAWFRDFAVLICLLVAIARRDFHEIAQARPSRFGKWTTVFYFVWFAVELAPSPAWLQWAAFAVATVLSVLTGAEYLTKLVAGLKERASANASRE